MSDKFRNVNVGRGYEINEDHLVGFETAVAANQQLLAMRHLIEVVKEYQDRITVLENTVVALNSAPKDSVPTYPQKEIDRLEAMIKALEGAEKKATTTRKPKAAEADATD